MKRTSPLSAAKVAIAIALSLSVLAATEMIWRIYGLGLVINVERQFPPMSAEAMSEKAAPLLRAASNAEQIYKIVQTQHVELQRKHEFVVDLAESARVTAFIGLACSCVAVLLLSFAHHRVARACVVETTKISDASDSA